MPPRATRRALALLPAQPRARLTPSLPPPSPFPGPAPPVAAALPAAAAHARRERERARRGSPSGGYGVEGGVLRQREQRRRGRLRRREKFRQADGVVLNELGARLRKISEASSRAACKNHFYRRLTKPTACTNAFVQAVG